MLFVELRDLHRSGGMFTRTNKQLNPIMVMLDRVFVSSDWEGHFRLVSASSLTRVGSDHNPILFKMDDEEYIRPNIFRFEAAWCLQEGFKEWVISKWSIRIKQYILDH